MSRSKALVRNNWKCENTFRATSPEDAGRFGNHACVAVCGTVRDSDEG